MAEGLAFLFDDDEDFLAKVKVAAEVGGDFGGGRVHLLRLEGWGSS